VQLAIDIAEANIVQIDQGDVAESTARQRFRRPGTDSAEADDADAALKQPLQSGSPIKARQTAEARVFVIHAGSITPFGAYPIACRQNPKRIASPASSSNVFQGE